MKLRMGRNSVRLRVLRSEVESLRAGKRLQETVCFGAEHDATLTFALAGSAEAQDVAAQFTGGQIVVLVPESRLQRWATSAEVGIEARLDTGAGCTLHVLIEKDFACLDRSDAENADTFEHPNAGTGC